MQTGSPNRAGARRGRDGAESSQLAPALGPRGRARPSDLGRELTHQGAGAGSSWPLGPLLRALLPRGCPAFRLCLTPSPIREDCPARPSERRRGWKQTLVLGGVEKTSTWRYQPRGASSPPASSDPRGSVSLHGHGVGGPLVCSGPRVLPSSQLPHATPRRRPYSRKPPLLRQEFTAMGSKGTWFYYFFLYHFWCNLPLSSWP